MKKLKKILVIIVVFIFLSGFSLPVFAATSNNTQVIENGIYEIEWVVNKNKVLDISAASTAMGANVQIWDKCNGGQQRFQFTYLSNGYYLIKNINSGKVLDVASAGTRPGTNIQQWESNNTDAQKWKLEKNSDGSFRLISKNSGLYLNVLNSKDTNGTNVEINKTKQSFNLKKITTVKGTKTLEDGIYKISTLLNTKKVLDISEASKASGANVQIWDDVNVNQQKFQLKYDGNGYYTIKNINSGKLLDVASAKTERGTNVWQWVNNGTDAQKWVIQKTSDGYYNIISKVSGINLEVAGNKANNGTNVQINFASNSANQKFAITKVEDDTKIIKDGTYEIATIISSNRVIDVSMGSLEDGANVQIWAATNVKQQKFDFIYVGGGYKIICKKSGKALTASNSNVYQSTYTGSDNQLWRLEKTSSGEYNLISVYNGKYLDVTNGTNANGTNIRVYTKNNSISQRFLLEQKKYGIDVSHWQNTIDFNSLNNAKLIDFIIIRAGQGTTIKDRQFERNYSETKKYGIPTGVYLYATAQTIEDARKEANYLVGLLKGKSFELPVYYDVEAQENLEENTITAMCNEFYRIIKSAGYKPGIYASKYYLMYKINPSKLPSDCSIWVASYGKNDGGIPNDGFKYSGRYDIWQFTSTGRVDGINGDVDYDVSYQIP